MTTLHVPAVEVTKYDPASTWEAECGETIVVGAPIYISSSDYKWYNAKADALSTLATHIALKAGTSAPTGVGNLTTKQLTGFTRGQIKLSTAQTAKIGHNVLLSNIVKGQYMAVAGNLTSIAQKLGTVLDTAGKIVEINIQTKKYIDTG